MPLPYSSSPDFGKRFMAEVALNGGKLKLHGLPGGSAVCVQIGSQREVVDTEQLLHACHLFRNADHKRQRTLLSLPSAKS